MHTGQLLLTLGALTLFSLTTLNVNRLLSNSDVALSQNRFRLEALSLLTAYKEETAQYFFDEASTDTAGKDLADFITPAQLGFDGNDAGVIDDFDDYHNTVVVDTGASGVVYKLLFEVDYVKLSGDSIVTSMTQEYHKRMKIEIVDNYPEPLLYRRVGGVKERDTLRISFIQSYWFYN